MPTAPPKLTPTNRYVPEGLRKFYWVVTIAVQAAPTRAEMVAGTDLSDEIAEVNGFTVTSSSVEVPDLSSRFTSKIPGRITADDSSLRFWASSNSNDVRSLLPRDTAGFVLCLWEGDVAAQKMDVFPVKVAALVMQTGTDDPGSLEAQFTITKTPSQFVAIPA
jgi:hypothetical protein